MCCMASFLLRSKLLAVQFLNNTLVPWPESVGANNMPVLMASNADGIHCLGASEGPRIIGNTIANAGDDAITIHGLYFIVAKVGRPPPLLKVFMFIKELWFGSSTQQDMSECLINIVKRSERQSNIAAC